jgi:hypothetical protein
MKKFSRILIVWMGLLTVCLLPIGASAQTFQDYYHQPSGVIGRVTTGFRSITGFMDDSDTGVTVSTVTGVYVTGVETFENGTFIVDLPPGNYVLQASSIPKPLPNGATPNFVMLGPSIPVTVKKDRLTIVRLPLSFRIQSLPLH